MFQVPVTVTLVGAPRILTHPNPGGIAQIGVNPIDRGIATQSPIQNQKRLPVLSPDTMVYAMVMF
jgi:hypothetical protein